MSGVRRGWSAGAWGLMAGVLAVLLALAAVAPGAAQEGDTATVEVRVWQDVGNELDIYVSARPAGGSWRTLGTIPLPLDDGTSSSGRFQYGDISLDVPLPGRADPATVEVRVWQDVGDSSSIFISARPAEGDWRILGTIPLPLDDGVSSSGRFRYGNISLDVPVPRRPVSTLAGSAGSLGSSDGQGDGARFGAHAVFSQHRPWALGLAAAPDGSAVVADYYNDAIRRVAPDGTVTTIAAGRGDRDGEAEDARFYHPRGVAVDGRGTIYVADERNHRIRRITADGIVSTIAGTGRWEYVDGPAEEAGIINPRGVALGPLGDLYIIEATRIRRLSPAGQVSTFAGGERNGYQDGWRENAEFFSLQAITIDDDGNIFVIDINDRGGIEEYSAVRLIDTTGTVQTVLRSDGLNSGGSLGYPAGIAPAGDGGVYLSNTGLHQLVRLTRAGDLEAVAGTGEKGWLDGTRGEARFNLPGPLALSPDGVLFVADQATTVVRAVELARGGLPAGAVPLATHEGPPRAVGVTVTALPQLDTFNSDGFALSPDGYLIGPGSFLNDVRRLAPDGTVTVLAGDGERGFLDGPAEEARFSNPSYVAVDADGNVYVLDGGNEAIRRIAPDGHVTTVLDWLPTGLFSITGLAVDANGNLLIGDESNGVWRLEDGQLSIAARVQPGWLSAIDVDASGRLHYAAGRSFPVMIGSISEVGSVTVLVEAGPGHYGGAFSGWLRDIAVASDGTVYAVDLDYQRVMSISPDGDIAIVVDAESFPGVTRFDPHSVLVTPEGDLLVSEFNRIWRITLP